MNEDNMTNQSVTEQFVAERQDGNAVEILECGTWYSGFTWVKERALENKIPLVAVWSNGDACGYCKKLEGNFLTDAFKVWMKTSKCIFWFGYSGDTLKEDKTDGMHWARENRLTTYPFMRFYWTDGTNTVNKTMTGNDWNEKLSGLKDVEITCSSSGSSSSMSSGGGSKTVTIKSHDIDALKEGATIAADAMRGVNGVSSISTSFSDSSSRAKIAIDPTRAAGAGLSPAQVGQLLYLAKSGSEATNLTVDEKEYTVTVEYPSDNFDTIQEVMNLTLTSPTGRQVVLSDIADVVYTDSPQTIYRTDKYYTCDITSTLNSELRFDAEKKIDEIAKNLALPRGVELGTNMLDEMQTETFAELGKAILVALFLVFMVMTIQFESARNSFMIMFTIPFSLIGSILLLVVTRCTLSMISLMGFLMLEGIVVNNGILFVDTTNQNLETMPVEEALVKAGESRLRPILMTTLTTILSMIPLGIGFGRNGKMMQGMAVVIIGGLVASTILTLIFLPTFYLIIRKKKKEIVQA